MAGLETVAPDPATVALQLAALFNGLSDATDDFRLAPRDPPLSDTDKSRLKDEAQALDSRAHHFTAVAIAAILASIQPSLDSIRATTSDATKALAKLNDVKKAIAIATAAVAVGAAIATGNAGAIGSSIGALESTLLP